MSNTAAKLPSCSRCGEDMRDQYFNGVGWTGPLCRKCWTTINLQNKNYTLVSHNVCTCDKPVEISICPKCGRAKYK